MDIEITTVEKITLILVPFLFMVLIDSGGMLIMTSSKESAPGFYLTL